MQGKSRWLRRAVTGVVAGVTCFTGLSALAVSAHATSSFTFTRVQGVDRYGTAGNIAGRAFNPNGTGTIGTAIIANGLPGHQSDALAASYLAGNLSAPILLVDGSSSVPQNTLTAISTNKITNCVVVGGTASVTSAEISALNSAGCTVSKTYAGATRYDTMQQIDTASGNTVGTSGTPAVKTCILASGDDAHLVDALGAGSLAYADKFPVILTSSSGSSLQPQASQTISSDGCQKLIVVGGSAAVPTSQYTPAPSGTTTDTSATGGADRSATSKLLADDAVTNYGLSNTGMGVATGATFVGNTNSLQNDGADALAASTLDGKNKFPTLVTLNPTDAGSVPSYASEHASTLAGSSFGFGGNRAIADSVLSTIATSGGGSFGTGSVSVNQTNAAQGGTITGTVANPGQVQSLAVSGCGFSNQSVTFDSTGNFTLTVPSSAPVGSCTMTFTATPTGGGSPVTTPVQFTVTSATAGSCTPSPQTALPQLCAAVITGTVLSNQGSSSAPSGTTVQYQFSKLVNTVTAANFIIYPFNWDGSGATSSCAGSQPPATIAGAPKLSGCSAKVESASNSFGGSNVDVLFPYVSSTTASSTATTPSNQVASNYTLATVIKNAVTSPAGTTNPEGSAAIGGGSSSTGSSTASAHTTSAPDLTGVTFNTVTSAGATTETPTNFTFDKTAYIATGQLNSTAGPTTTTGSTPGFYLVFPDNTQVQCNTQSVATSPASGGTVPGGSGSSTITVLCPNVGGSAAGGSGNGTTLTTGNVARAFVGDSTVATAASTTCTAPGQQTGGAFCNPQQAFHFGNATTGPDLVSVTPEPAGTNGNADTTRDAVLYTFDQAANAGTGIQNTGFGIYQTGANEIASTAAVSGTTVGGNANQVVAYFPKGSLNGSAASSTGPATGAFVRGGGLNSGVVANVSGNTTVNQPDELGMSPVVSTTAGATAGSIDGPQLSSVALNQVTTPAQTQSYVATYTFSQPASYNGTPGLFKLYLKDGSELDATSCANVSSTASTNTQVACSAYTIVSSPSGLTLGAATSAQIGSAVLGTVVQKAVTGQATNFTAPNPEGAQDTTGHT